MADLPLFARMDAQEIADLERATGLLVDEEEAWSLEDYDSVIAYLRRQALTPAAFISGPKRAWFTCRPDACPSNDHHRA